MGGKNAGLIILLAGALICFICFLILKAYQTNAREKQRLYELQQARERERRERERMETEEAERELIAELFELEEKEAEKSRAEDILNHKLNKIHFALFKREYDKAISLFDEAVRMTTPELHAVPRHFFFLSVLDDLYALRNENPEVLKLCLYVCDFDFSQAEHLLKDMEPPFNMLTPTRAAIILEKMGDLEAALNICDAAISWGVWDSGKKSFEERRARLAKRLIKTSQ